SYPSLAAAKAVGAPVVGIGVFLNSIFDFLIVSFVIFLLIRQVNRMKRQTEVPPAAPMTRDCPFCWSSIPIKATRCPHCTSELKAA
ncbi:MAG: MscL family protein, partial [Nitrospiraceae bacterium]